MLYNVYIAQVIMAKAAHAPVKKVPAHIPAPRAGNHEGRFTGEYEITSGPAVQGKTRRAVPAKDPRAPLQILRSTKEWLDQIIAERDLRTYDEAIMFLITERQRNLPSDFGVFSDMEEYVCKGED